MSAFATLNSVDVSEHVEQKNRLNYLSWAWAWAELKKRYPNSFYTIYENASGCFYHTDGKTCWVKTGVTLVDGEYSLEHIEYLPVMDFKNASISVDKVTSFEVNKAIQRSLTKAVARHGLGLYIYAGEDLPEGADAPSPSAPNEQQQEAHRPPVLAQQPVTRKSMIDAVIAELGIDATQFDAIAVRLRGHSNYVDKDIHASKREENPMTKDELVAALNDIKAEYARLTKG